MYSYLWLDLHEMVSFWIAASPIKFRDFKANFSPRRDFFALVDGSVYFVRRYLLLDTTHMDMPAAE